MPKFADQIRLTYASNKLAVFGLLAGLVGVTLYIALTTQLAAAHTQWKIINPSGIAGVNGDTGKTATIALESAATSQALTLYGAAVLIGLGALALGFSGYRQYVYKVTPRGGYTAPAGILCGFLTLIGSTSLVLTQLNFGLHYYH